MIGLSVVGAGAVAGLGWLLGSDEKGTGRRGPDAEEGGTGQPGGDASNRPANADNPFQVKAGAPLEVLFYDGAYGSDYLSAAERLYRTERRPSKITMQAVRGTSREDLTFRIENGNAPDLIDNAGPNSLDPDALVDKGAVLELGALLDAPSYDDPKVKVRDTLLPHTVEMGYYRGRQVHALHYGYTVYGVWYSAKLLADHGWQYPTTWDEMLKLCADARRKGIAGWTYPGKYPHYLAFSLLPFIGKIGGPQVLRAIDNLEAGAWRQEAVSAAFQAYAELGAKGHVMEGSGELDHIASQTAWAQGKALFLPNGSWVGHEMKATLPQRFGLSVSGPSGLDSSDALPFGTTWAHAQNPFLVPKETANAAGGLEMLRLMLSKEVARDFVSKTDSLTCLGTGAEESVTGNAAGTAALRLVRKAGKNLLNPRLMEWYPELVKDRIGIVLGELLSGRTTPTEAVNTIQRAADETARDPRVRRRRHP